MKLTSYSDYSVRISNEPSYYGSECSQADANRIAASLTKMIETEFPGIRVTTSGRDYTGPDSDTCEEIRAWVESNWTAAL